MERKRNWDEEYEQFVAEFKAADHPDKLDHERRQHPRIEVPVGGLDLDILADIKVIDSSMGGMAFTSTVDIPIGSVFPVSVNELFTIEATVIDCEMFEDDENLMDYRYRVRCEFKDQNLGKRMIVMLTRLGSTNESKDKSR